MNLPTVGAVVRFTTQTARYGHGLIEETRVGRVIGVWSMDGADAIVDTDVGSFHPSLGDTWERLAVEPEPR